MSRDRQPRGVAREDTPVPPRVGFIAGLGRHKTLIAFAFLTPMLLGVTVFFIYPLIMTVYYSFTSVSLLSTPKWNGVANWVYMFTKDKTIRVAATNTLWFVLIMVPARVISAMFIASMLTRARMASGLLRTVFYLPALIPPVASTISFVYVFNPSTGPVNALLSKISVGLQDVGIHVTLMPGWFTSAGMAKPSLTLLSMWVVGEVMVIFLASMLDVPIEQYEAAELDGAGNIARFRYVTLPNLQPVILFSAVTGIIAALQYFTEPAVASAIASGKTNVGGGMSTTMGWPNNMTTTYGQWLYRQAFAYNNMGYASAMAVVMFLISAAVIFFLLRRFTEFSPEVSS